MELSRHEQRYKAMTILYQIKLYETNNIDYDIDNIIDSQTEVKSKFITNLVHGVVENIKEIDECANKYLDNWTLDRLGLTDQAILRIAIYELLYTDVPSLVSIDEAVELAKNYSDDSVCKMINGVLDKVYHSRVDNEQ